MFRKPVSWIVLIVLCLGAAAYSWQVFPQAFPLVNVDLTMNRSAALDSAQTRAERLELGPDGFRQAAEFRQDGQVQRFVELEAGGKEAFRQMIDAGHYQPYQWAVRHFEEEEPREIEFRFTPDGRPYGFEEEWPEDADGPAISADSARALAEREATQYWTVDQSQYELISSSQEERPNGRVDHTFVYERPDIQVGEGRYRLRLGVSGASLSEVTRFVKVPEGFTRRYQEMRSANSTINLGGTAAMVLIYILGGCLFGLYWLVRNNALKWRMAVVWGGIIAGLQLLVGLNQLPLAWMDYDTALLTQDFLVQQILFRVGGAVGIGLLVTVSFMAAEGLTRMAFGHHPRLWRLWNPRAAGTTDILGRTASGYLLVAVFFAYQVALYTFAQDALGWWSPADLLFDPNILAQYAPWLPPIANALQAGFWEECLFRAVPLAGAALIGDRLGYRRWWIGGALGLQAVIFGAVHAGYATQPAFARLVELILPAIGFGLLYLSYGLLPAIVLHFAFDVVWMALPLFVSTAPGVWMHQVAVVGLTLIPLFAVLYGRLHTGEWLQLPNRFYNRSWTPSDEETTEETTLPVLAGLSWCAAGTVAVAGLLGLGAWIGTSDFSTVEDPLSMTRAEAESSAQMLLKENGVDPEAWTMVAGITAPRDQDDRFIWQNGGRDAYQQLMGSYLAGPYWDVRFITFDAPVEERAEEYHVHLAPASNFREIVHQLPEAAPGDSLPQSTARALSDSVVQSKYDRNPASLKEVGAKPTARPNRRDWTFTYADTAGYPIDQGEARIKVELAGSEVTDASTFIHTPESWEREVRQRETSMQIVSWIAGLLVALLAIAGTVAAIVYWARGRFHIASFFVVTGGVFLLGLVGLANGWPETLSNFNTAQPFLHQVAVSVLAPLIASALGSGGLGLLAGLAHARVGRNEPTPLIRTIVTGLGLGALGLGLLSLAGQVGPSLTPPWANYEALDQALPWLAPVTSRLLSFAGIGVVTLLVAVAVHRWTRACQRRVPTALGSVFVLGFVGAGIGPAETLSVWALQGALLGGLTDAAVWFVWRYDRSVLPMTAAGVVILQGIAAMVTAPTSSILVGEGVGLLLVSAVAVGWTIVLKRSQSATASSVD